MKRFMYFSISILCLSIAALIGFYIGSESVQAQAPRAAITPSSPSTGIIVGVDWAGFVLDYLGQVWYMRYGCWERRPQADPPVPVSEIKLWSYYTIVTNDDSVWELRGGIPCGNNAARGQEDRFPRRQTRGVASRASTTERSNREELL